MDVFRSQSLEERGVERDAEAPAGRLGRAVDGGFDGAAVGGLRAEARGPRIAEDNAVLFSNKKAVPTGFRELREPLGAVGDGLRLEVEGRGRR